MNTINPGLLVIKFYDEDKSDVRINADVVETLEHFVMVHLRSGELIAYPIMGIECMEFYPGKTDKP